MEKNRGWILASRPTGNARVENFRFFEADRPTIQEGQFLVRSHWMSLDPYMRGRMDAGRSYAIPQPLDQVMQGAAAGEVIESRHPGFKAGDKVVGGFGWQLYGVSDGTGVRKVDDSNVPLSAFLGAVGMPGVTAWVGLNRIIVPKAGETVVVSAASGAVGAVVGQLAKRAGARVVGVAGGPDKCRAVIEEFGFDACVDYKAGRLEEDLAAATPNGIDGNFENVGGPVMDAVLARMNPFGRVAVCGLISFYDGAPMPILNFRSVLMNRLKIQGFIVSEVPDAWPPALAELQSLAASGALKFRETVDVGIERAPEAFLGLLRGRNFGKQLVKLV